MDGVVYPLTSLGGLQIRGSGTTQGAVTVRVLAENLEAVTSTLAGTPGLRLADMFAANDSPATTLRLVWAHDRGYLVTETEIETETGVVGEGEEGAEGEGEAGAEGGAAADRGSGGGDSEVSE